MPVVKKLKFDIHGNGDETIIKISIDSKGLFGADIPNYVKVATNITCSREETMFAAINTVNTAIWEYCKLQETKSVVILIEFERQSPPFLNSGLGLTFNYGIAEKIVFGKKINYKYAERTKDGTLRYPGNNFTTHRMHFEKGVCGGASTEIPYTEDNYTTILQIYDNLEQLCTKLSEICNSEINLLQLVETKIKSLGAHI